MLNTIDYKIMQYRFDGEKNRWLIQLEEKAYHEKVELPVSIVAKSDALMKQLSVEDSKIIYFLYTLERQQYDPKFAAQMCDILCWRNYREDDLQLTDDFTTWPVTASHQKAICYLVAYDYVPGKNLCKLTFQYVDSGETVSVSAKYVIGDDDFLSRLSLEDREQLVFIVVNEWLQEKE